MNSNNYKMAIEELSTLIAEGEKNHKLDLSDIKLKIESIKDMLSDDTLKIVLLGATCDGKTTTAAGMLGKVLNKIDNDESSDELTFYHVEGLSGVEIVDTPGLFGSKEKEEMGKTITFSDITERYISEAHVLLYVTDAVDPVKESHSNKLRWVLKDLSKLPSTVFVINKMDEAGFDLDDDADFERGCSIKKKFLIDGLARNIGLSVNEAANMNVICISADPGGKGLERWFSKPDKYEKRSHIKKLKDTVKQLSLSSNTEALNNEAIKASFKDVTNLVNNIIGASSEEKGKAVKNAQEASENLQFELNDLNKQLLHNKSILTESILAYRKSLINTINSAGMETFSDMLDEEIGVQDGKVTGKIFTQKIEAILSECGNSNNSSISAMSVSYEKSLGTFDTSLNILGNGTKLLKNANISGGMIKGIRNVILPSFKFKPWQAVNIASKLSKGLAIASIVINGILFWRKKKAVSAFNKAKTDLKDAITESFDDIAKMYASNEDYYQNFAPSYLEMSKLKDERMELVSTLVKQNEELDSYKTRLSGWLDSVAK